MTCGTRRHPRSIKPTARARLRHEVQALHLAKEQFIWKLVQLAEAAPERNPTQWADLWIRGIAHEVGSRVANRRLTGANEKNPRVRRDRALKNLPQEPCPRHPPDHGCYVHFKCSGFTVGAPRGTETIEWSCGTYQRWERLARGEGVDKRTRLLVPWGDVADLLASR